MHINNGTNIIVLCNNEIAIPALQQLFVSGVLRAVVLPENNKELFSILQPLLADSPVSLVGVNKKNLSSIITNLVTQKKITAAWLMTFPIIIPAALLNVMPGGFINFHYGILPKYRGSNPILAQMINGETHSGITIHVADEKIDTGPIILQQKIAIEDNDTFGMQLQKLSLLGASMAMHLLRFYNFAPVMPSVPQDESLADYFNRVIADDLIIRWDKMNSRQIIRMINACNPWNKGAGTFINNQVIRLTSAEILEDNNIADLCAGTIIALDDKEGLKIFCSDKKSIRINIIYTELGFFPGKNLADYGIKAKDKFLS